MAGKIYMVRTGGNQKVVTKKEYNNLVFNKGYKTVSYTKMMSICTLLSPTQEQGIPEKNFYMGGGKLRHPFS